MATATSRTRKATAAKAKPAPEPEPEEIEEVEDEEFEEIEEAEESSTPAKKSRGGASTVVFGVSDLAQYLSDKVGKEVTTRELRSLIRRMARDESGRVDRVIVAGNRSRYDWPEGLKNPEVKAIIAAYIGGEGEIEKKEKLAALKQKNDAARAAAPKKAVAKKAVAKKPAVVEDDEVEDEDELDFGDE